jgi:hypothetical protein
MPCPKLAHCTIEQDRPVYDPTRYAPCFPLSHRYCQIQRQAYPPQSLTAPIF